MIKKATSAYAFIFFTFLAFPTFAGGGYGTVTVESTTANRITINWSEPDGNLRHASNPPRYEICYKEAGRWVGTCAHTTPIYTSTRPYELKDLTPGKTYKVKVSTYTEKKNFWGKWKNPRYRKVGTLTQTTSSTHVPTDPHGNIEFVGATASSATIRTHWSHPLDLERILVCYKKTWYPVRLDAGCFHWILPNPDYGWADLAYPTAISTDITIPNLSNCRQYKFETYGLYRGGGSVQIGGEIKGRTRGTCKIFFLSEFIDSDDFLPLDYVHEVEMFYGISLSEHILEENPQLAREHHILETSGENVSEPLIFLDYLIEAHPEVVDAWQSEKELQDAGLAVEQFLAARNPELLRVLLEDIAADESPSLGVCSEVQIVPFHLADVAGGSGINTLFAVRNLTEASVDADVEYLAVDGTSRQAETLALDPHETRTVSLRDVPGLPADDDGFRRGFVKIITAGSPDRTPVLAGDFFQVDSIDNFATGDRLLRQSALCAKSSIRVLDFGAGTRLVVFVANPRGLAAGTTDPPTFTVQAYDEAGNALSGPQPVWTDRHAIELAGSDFAVASFGSLTFDFTDSGGGAVYAEYSAHGRFSVGVVGDCLGAPSSDEDCCPSSATRTTISGLHYPSFSECEPAVSDALRNLDSFHYRNACQEAIGGGLPDSVLGTRVVSCEIAPPGFSEGAVVSVEVCCPEP